MRNDNVKNVLLYMAFMYATIGGIVGFSGDAYVATIFSMIGWTTGMIYLTYQEPISAEKIKFNKYICLYPGDDEIVVSIKTQNENYNYCYRRSEYNDALQFCENISGILKKN